MIFVYHCQKCGQEMPVDWDSMKCKCGGDYRLTSGFPGIIGTRDSFGVGKEFISDKGEVIDTWTKWERAGYKNPLTDSNLPAEAKSQIKRKVEKIEKYDSGKKFSVLTGGTNGKSKKV